MRQTVCDWADSASCERLVFTSSISPYGPSEEQKDEGTVPVPETAYGSSKLAAEKIHLVWQAGCRSSLEGYFGPGEGDNVTRLIRSLEPVS
jgi:nucleoside-diphosphate-sugar epimerase